MNESRCGARSQGLGWDLSPERPISQKSEKQKMMFPNGKGERKQNQNQQPKKELPNR
jgi:hypothetical protein